MTRRIPSLTDLRNKQLSNQWCFLMQKGLENCPIPLHLHDHKPYLWIRLLKTLQSLNFDSPTLTVSKKEPWFFNGSVVLVEAVDLNPRPRVFPKDFLRAAATYFFRIRSWRHVSRLHNHYPVVPALRQIRYLQVNTGWRAVLNPSSQSEIVILFLAFELNHYFTWLSAPRLADLFHTPVETWRPHSLYRFQVVFNVFTYFRLAFAITITTTCEGYPW